MFMACGPEKFRYAQDDFVLTHGGKTQAFVNGEIHFNHFRSVAIFLISCKLFMFYRLKSFKMSSQSDL